MTHLDDTHSLNVSIANQVGAECALIYRKLCAWVKHNIQNEKNFHDGLHWTYNSTKAFEEEFTYFSCQKIGRLLKKLEESGLIKKGNYNKMPFDRTCWYACPIFEAEYLSTKKSRETSGSGEIHQQFTEHSMPQQDGSVNKGYPEVKQELQEPQKTESEYYNNQADSFAGYQWDSNNDGLTDAQRYFEQRRAEEDQREKSFAESLEQPKPSGTKSEVQALIDDPNTDPELRKRLEFGQRSMNPEPSNDDIPPLEYFLNQNCQQKPEPKPEPKPQKNQVTSGMLEQVRFGNEIRQIMDHLDRKTNTRNRVVTIDMVMALTKWLAEGYRVEDIQRMISFKCSQWLNDEKMKVWLIPSTLFGEKHFKEYMEQSAGYEDLEDECRRRYNYL